MAIYDGNGNELFVVYDGIGNELENAYDGEGNRIYQKSPVGIKVMAYNVGGWYTGVGTSVPSAWDAQYYALQNGILSRNLPDVLCIEEYRDQFTTGGRTALSVLSPYFPYIEARSGTTDYWGRAICSKYPILSYAEYFYTNEANRYYGDAVININGRSVHVIVTHLSTDQAKREVQGRELFNYVQTLDKFIACGDYNSKYAKTTDPTSEWSDEYYSIYEQYVNAGYQLANCSEQNGFYETYWQATLLDWYCLDNIITSENIAIDDVYTDTAKETNPVSDDPNWKIDHIPLIAEITVS